jgi:hypothetical protein
VAEATGNIVRALAVAIETAEMEELAEEAELDDDEDDE